MYQVKNNPVYARFTDALGLRPQKINDLKDIPLLPVRAFRETEMVTANGDPDLIFESSGTGGMKRSVHKVYDKQLCIDSVTRGFHRFYPNNAVIWAYTPGYTENPRSSLIWMLKTLINRTGHKSSRFLPLDQPIQQAEADAAAGTGKPLILFGAAFGIIDLVEINEVTLPANAIVIETGGMKTYRRELDRKELHKRIASGFGISSEQVHSEYGMCELLSQAYSKETGWFETTPWMQVTIRDPENPARICEPGEEGLIGVIDLANIDSCSFLLTGDKGVSDESGRFSVLGRWNPLELRGCNFLIDQD